MPRPDATPDRDPTGADGELAVDAAQPGEEAAPGQVVLLVTSPRLPPGLLSAQAWSLLRAGRVIASGDPDPQADALRAEGVAIADLTPDERDDPAAALLAAAQERPATPVVWLTSPDGDPGLVDALAREAAVRFGRGAPPASVEVLVGSYDPPGARLLDLVAVMDRLRSPGGCPWDAQQTHRSLAPYLLEETYEVLEALDLGDDEHLREELGDLLLQVVFHSRIAQERAESAWSVDDVAGGIVAKLVRRHPHVFGAGADVDPARLEEVWEADKALEKGRVSATEGIPPALPALALAAKLVGRARRAGLPVRLGDEDRVAGSLLPAESARLRTMGIAVSGEEAVQGHGSALLAAAAAAVADGVDPEQALRLATYRLAAAIRTAEAAGD